MLFILCRMVMITSNDGSKFPDVFRIDMDMINTGRTTVEREMEESLHIGLREFLAEVRLDFFDNLILYFLLTHT